MAKQTFASKREAEDFILNELVLLSIYSENLTEEAVQVIAGSIAPTLRAEYNSDDTWAAAEHFADFIANVPDGLDHIIKKENGEVDQAQAPAKQAPGGGTVQTQTNQADKKKVVNWKPAVLSSEEANKHIEEQSTRLIQEGLARQATASLDKFVIANNPKDIVEALKGEKVKVTATAADFKKYEENLVPGEENKAVFESVKKRALAGEAFEVHVSSVPSRAIGAVVSYDEGGTGKGQVKPHIIPEKDMFELLISKLANRIPTGDRGLGVKFESLRATRSSGHANAAVESVKPKLVYVGRTQALKDETHQHLEYANKVTGETVRKSVPIKEVFEVYLGADKVNNDGSRKTRKVRLQGPTEKYPVFTRASQEMHDAFGEINRTDVITPTTQSNMKEEIAKIADTFRTAVRGEKMEIPASLAQLVSESQAMEAKSFSKASDVEGDI